MEKYKKYLFSVYRFFIFFLLIAFVVTCSFLIFLRFMDLDIQLLRRNAVATFLNVLFLSLVFCVIDSVRRKLTVEKPVKRITRSLKQIKSGDYTEKIKPVPALIGGQFNPIIEDINLLTEELSGVETLRTDFISNVSHELRTPLSVIQNYATILQSPDLPEDKREEYTSDISSAAGRLSDLITNILKLNKLENQQIEQLCECLLGFENVWESKELDIQADIDEDVYINGDRELLSLVWNNLFSNAIKFTEPGGKISVSLKKDDEGCTVKVADTGCGISREAGAHIFEKFYQADPSHATQGNGLGLALVKRVIDIVGGEISVESEINKGSTFTVRLDGGLDEEIKKDIS